MPFDSVDAYLAAQPPLAREALTAVRDIIRTAVPDAEESIAYDMPTYKRHGKPFAHIAAWANHWSIYGINDRVRAAFADDLKSHVVENSTIRFSYGEPLPKNLITRLIQYRAELA